MQEDKDQPGGTGGQDTPQQQGQQPPPPPPPATPATSPGFGIAALVLGIVGIFLFWIPFFGWILPILALIFGIIGIVNNSGKGMAIAGAILGGLVMVGFLVTVVLGLSMFGSQIGRAIDEAREMQQHQEQMQRQREQGAPQKQPGQTY